ncbi:MAG: Hsp20/alpha crystallin family protein [Oscillospiraceae bacterium]|nr:Hsp20/alpha crystallin family protein [Oscillospiraceae bacterium]
MFELIPFERRMASFDPFRMMADMERSFFAQPSTRAVSTFRTDVSDIGDAYKLEAELPGFKKEDISIDIKDERLTISAERKFENEDEKPNFVKRERFYGSYSRSFGLEGINSDAIEASYVDGVLSLRLPKQTPVVPESRRIEIN